MDLVVLGGIIDIRLGKLVKDAEFLIDGDGYHIRITFLTVLLCVDKGLGLCSEEFCERLLYSQRVALVPGNAFGGSGEGFVRASYCYSVEHLKEALRRIEIFLNEIKSGK